MLVSQSAYFQGLLEFNEAQQSHQNEITLNVQEYSKEVFEAMIKFLYLGETKVNSNDLVDLLNLCQEYLLPGIKQAIEHVFADQLNMELFIDIYMLAKAFDLRFLKYTLMNFAANNRQALMQKQLLTQLDKDDLRAINRIAQNK